MLRIAIIGANSFIGRQIIRDFSLLDVDLITWGRSVDGFNYHFDYPKHFVQINDLVEADFIIYTAGVGVQAGEKPSKEHMYGVNTLTPINLINQLTDHQYQGTFISFGSYFEIGKQDSEVKRTEKEVVHSLCKPTNEYGLSKRLLSKFIYEQLVTETNIKLMHFILPNIFGVGENSARIIPSLVEGIKTNSEISVSSGEQVRQFLSVKDLTSFLTEMIGTNNSQSGIYNLASDNILTVRVLIEVVIEIGVQLGFKRPPLSIGNINKRDLGMPYLAIDDQKARTVLNWHNKNQLEYSIKEYFND